MRWKTKEKPKPGDWRIKTRFAWLPVTTTMPNNETVIWLERYQTNDSYSYLTNEWTTKQIAPMGYWEET